jgi:hypothetical protein
LECPGPVEYGLFIKDVGLTGEGASDLDSTKEVLIEVERELGLGCVDFWAVKKTVVHALCARSHDCDGRLLVDSPHLADLPGFVLWVILNGTQGVDPDISHTNLMINFDGIG